METRKQLSIFLAAIFLVLVAVGCVRDYLDVPVKPKPKIGKETNLLEAAYVPAFAATLNNPYWNEADYLIVDLQDLSTEFLYTEDGLLNMTGTFKGISDFNEGHIPTLKLKAAYDESSIYILAEWDDSRIDASRRTWLWNGDPDSLKPGESSIGWTSQRNDDNIAIAFDINGASSSAGTFANIGCAATCHLSGNEVVMEPESGNVDIWKWSLALSAPFGFAFDMVAKPGSGVGLDLGTVYFHRNSLVPGDNRVGPAYEWDGASQDVTRGDGSPSKIDPGFFLQNKVPYSGNPTVGEVLYLDDDKGCQGCHGEKGKGYGPYGDGPPLNNASFARKFSRTTLDNYASDPSHDGNTYYTKLSIAERDNLIAYIRGLAGLPGYYFTQPVPGESLNDVLAISNINLVRLETTASNNTYKVMFVRLLNTGNSDDILFEPAVNSAYPFGVALMDNDGKNHIGSLLETLIFLQK